MCNERSKQLLMDIGVLLSGDHFVLTPKERDGQVGGSGVGGNHATDYVFKDRATMRTVSRFELCAAMARLVAHLRPQVAVGTPMGGILLAGDVAHHLSLGQEEVLTLYAERERKRWYSVLNGNGTTLDLFYETGKMVVKRNADAMRGKRVVVVEDVLSTGSSARAAVGAVRAADGDVVAVVALWNRGRVTPGMVDAPLCSLVDQELPTMTPEQCREHGPCSQGVAINTTVGHGADFVLKYGQPVAPARK